MVFESQNLPSDQPHRGPHLSTLRQFKVADSKYRTIKNNIQMYWCSDILMDDICAEKNSMKK